LESFSKDFKVELFVKIAFLGCWELYLLVGKSQNLARKFIWLERNTLQGSNNSFMMGYVELLLMEIFGGVLQSYSLLRAE